MIGVEWMQDLVWTLRPLLISLLRSPARWALRNTGYTPCGDSVNICQGGVTKVVASTKMKGINRWL